ncbi:MAG: SDR family NAD(P)-dependent oxidoreductase, partial [Candidatus Marinimicrobia bacterium]|nr:SDR family NAD(P)-dependent oxidoreductase [Candidatus Neomarinimicrobiota bacterium]
MSVILITGCSSGFGLNTAARLAASDHTIYASMRDLQKKDDLLEEVARRGGEVHLVRLDVTDDETIKAVIEQIEEEAGRLDVIINNAGYAIGGFFEDLTEQEIRDQMETNFF